MIVSANVGAGGSESLYMESMLAALREKLLSMSGRVRRQTKAHISIYPSHTLRKTQKVWRQLLLQDSMR
jgi:hypothetical protein